MRLGLKVQTRLKGPPPIMAPATRSRDRHIDPKFSTSFDKPRSERHFGDRGSPPPRRPRLSSSQSLFAPLEPRSSPSTRSAPLTAENLRALERFGRSLSLDPQSIPEAYMRRKGSPKKPDKRKAKKDPDSHPLNLPPDELRRLSAAMAKDENSRRSMDQDGSLNDWDTFRTPETEWQPSTPLHEAPGAFPESANGVSNGVNGHTQKSPTPPPHKLPPKPQIDAEACKIAGNKFFKAKDYQKAIEEYTKGVQLWYLM